MPVNRIFRPDAAGREPSRKSLKAGPVCVPPPSQYVDYLMVHWHTNFEARGKPTMIKCFKASMLDGADPVAAWAPNEVRLDQDKDDAPYSAPERKRDELRHAKRCDLVHVVGHVGCHADEMEQKQPNLMKDQGSDEVGDKTEKQPRTER